MATVSPPAVALLSEDHLPRRPLAGTMWMGMGRRPGRVVSRLPAGGWRRAEQGSVGPLTFEVRPSADRLAFQVWGPAATPADEAERALVAARHWAGLDDDPTGFSDLVSTSPTLRGAVARLGVPILGRLPRAAESFGRAVIGQLVQGLEAGRSTAQMIAMTGTKTPHGVWAYPTRLSLGSTSAHRLRTCGISLRSAAVLHRFTLAEQRFEQLYASRRWDVLDRHIRQLPGAGIWTAAETRLYLGDPDAVSYGDYHIPALVGWALGDRTETDQAMEELLAPYAPQRGRVIRLLERAAARGLVAGKPRRGPRQALSAHRYW
ncbi:DNA-3-methyladenine glycosylase [soil metagenome]